MENTKLLLTNLTRRMICAKRRQKRRGGIVNHGIVKGKGKRKLKRLFSKEVLSALASLIVQTGEKHIQTQEPTVINQNLRVYML